MDCEVYTKVIENVLNLNLPSRVRITILYQYKYTNKIFHESSIVFNRCLIDAINERDDLDMMLECLNLYVDKHKFIFILYNLSNSPKIKKYIADNYCNDCLLKLTDKYVFDGNHKFCDNLCLTMFYF